MKKMKTPVVFKNKTMKMAGELYVPDNFDEKRTYPAIVCVHPMGGVKEQVIGLYSQHFSRHGFISLTFDASHQGESEGEPRLLEDPNERVEDVRCAVDYLTTLPYVDEERIGVFGICAGGGYAISVAQTERRIRAVATVSAVDVGGGIRDFLGRGTPVSENLKTLDSVAKQRTVEARGGTPLLVPVVPDSPEEINANTPVLMREAYEYYRTPRGQHPNSPNRFLFSSMDKLMAFSGFSLIDTLLTQPILLVAGSEADTLIFSKQAYDLSKGPKELFLVDGATHIDMYDIPKYVDQAVEKLVDFYGKSLKSL